MIYRRGLSGILITRLLEIEQFLQTAEILFKNQSNALCVQTGACEIPVVCLIIHLDGGIARWCKQVSYIKVADKFGGGGACVVSIAKLSVDKQAVIEQSSAEQSLIFRIVPTFVTSRNVGFDVPVVTLDDRVEHVVDLSGDGARQQALHGKCGLALSAIIGKRCVIVCGRIKAADAQQIYHLPVQLFLTVEDALNHLLFIGTYSGEVYVKIYLWGAGLSGDIHQAMYLGGGSVREAVAQVQVGT